MCSQNFEILIDKTLGRENKMKQDSNSVSPADAGKDNNKHCVDCDPHTFAACECESMQCANSSTPSACPHCHSHSIEYVEDRQRWVCLNCTAKFRSDGYVLGWADILAEDAEYEHFEHYQAESNAQFDDFRAGEALV